MKTKLSKTNVPLTSTAICLVVLLASSLHCLAMAIRWREKEIQSPKEIIKEVDLHHLDGLVFLCAPLSHKLYTWSTHNRDVHGLIKLISFVLTQKAVGLRSHHHHPSSSFGLLSWEEEVNHRKMARMKTARGGLGKGATVGGTPKRKLHRYWVVLSWRGKGVALDLDRGYFIIIIFSWNENPFSTFPLYYMYSTKKTDLSKS